jgi:hypothetical protein
LNAEQPLEPKDRTGLHVTSTCGDTPASNGFSEYKAAQRRMS